MKIIIMSLLDGKRVVNCKKIRKEKNIKIFIEGKELTPATLISLADIEYLKTGKKDLFKIIKIRNTSKNKQLWQQTSSK